MAQVEIRMYENERGQPHRVAALFVDGERVPVRSMEFETERQPSPLWDDIDPRVRGVVSNTSWGVLYRLHVNENVLVETADPPTREIADDDAIVYRWADVRLLFETDPQIRTYKEIAANLFARYPNARFGPAHVVLEDGNWDQYEDAITLTLFVLATRSLRALGVDDMIDEQPLLFYKFMPAALIAERADYYADHSIAELGATLGALELIRWHEEGHQGDAPKE